MVRNKFFVILAACALLSACSGKFETWHDEPSGGSTDPIVTVFFDADSVPPIDMRGIAGDSLRLFRPTIMCSEPYSVVYSVNIYNYDRTDTISLRAYDGGRAITKQVQQALNTLFGPLDVQHKTTIDVTADITVDGKLYRGQADSVALVITPRQRELPKMWYVMGSHIGNGAWTNTPEAVYSCLVPMTVEPTNYNCLTYAGYFPTGTEFRIVPEPGNDDVYIGGGDENGGQTLQDETMEGDPLDNIVVRNGGYLLITVDVSNAIYPAVHIERLPGAEDVATVTLNTASGDVPMTPMTTASGAENHNWVARSVLLAESEPVAFTTTVMLRTDSLTTEPLVTTLGSSAWPIGRALDDAMPFKATSGVYTVVFNDISRYYWFIRQD